jgi:hypothetical protein
MEGHLRAVPDWDEPVSGHVIGGELVRRPDFGFQPNIARAASTAKGIGEMGVLVVETLVEYQDNTAPIVHRSPSVRDYAGRVGAMVGEAGITLLAHEVRRALR